MNGTLAGVLGTLILAFPLAGCVLCALLGPRYGRRFVNWVGPGVVGLSFLVALIVLAQVVGAPEHSKSTTVEIWNWLFLGAGNLHVGVDLTLDPLSTVMIMVICGVGFLIHLYSVGYMEHDPGIARFFSYMNLFIFSMLLLVLAADLVILIIGWALVALSSYLLIGYWYERPSAVLAARKAFITQVIGDVAMIIAAAMLFTSLHDAGGHRIFTLSLPTIFANASSSFSHGGPLITGICALLAIGAFAKSAQFPLHTWLPDAMEGPTPVSALIHAATMVTAGVYLIARFHVLYDLAPVAAGMVACVGIGTAVMAGVIALSQVDIKRVIAYSTMSQIGLMIFAVGIGAYTAGMYHFVTHALFKALLFMAAGNVIHALADEQDIRLMGGLSARMRQTEVAFLAGSFALAGIPIFAGWFSKEYLLGFGAVSGPLSPLLYLVGIGVNVLTGLYAFRLWAIVFRGEPQTARGYAVHEAPPVMLWPVLALAGLSTLTGLIIQWPIQILGGGAHLVSGFLDPVFAAGGHPAGEPGAGVAALALIAGTAASLVGVGGALRLWLWHQPDAQAVASRVPRSLTLLSLHKFYFDELYDAVLVRPTRAAAQTMRRVVEPGVMDGWVRGLADVFAGLSLDFRSYQSGLIRDYASYMIGATAVGVVVIVFVIAH
ncbi:MAG: NADH-quinone oxidoreductase subunit L [Chloroflexi bacterium]|nr:MAG: NADH-quinone oxidoreductase subunit L [Chloroflexota bacterium]